MMGFLMLERRKGEKVFMRDANAGTEIVVLVRSIGKEHVKLGFDAPDHINIVREEAMVTEDRTAICDELFATADDLKALALQLKGAADPQGTFFEAQQKFDEIQDLLSELENELGED
jgi:carbon storage regulator CsrA